MRNFRVSDESGHQELFCRWYEKPLKDISEHEAAMCLENGQGCYDCPDAIIREKEGRVDNAEF